jgi:Na+(H+)/acetate symporter ActP
MKTNMGSLDRMLRVVAAIVIAALYLTGQISGLAALILGVLAVVFLLTSAVGTCPLYLPFGFSTRPPATT